MLLVQTVTSLQNLTFLSSLFYMSKNQSLKFRPSFGERRLLFVQK